MSHKVGHQRFQLRICVENDTGLNQEERLYHRYSKHSDKACKVFPHEVASGKFKECSVASIEIRLEAEDILHGAH